ncbi:MAG TPA: carboxypeptidase-like regulatory domain-containing protein, partial [Candidatus Polarisedimenticolia bacterium]|nr:carboxypeptidase-like regulatory domain-containing protein [Candidatus Polarisedimenticolia bacterium]
MNFTVIAAISLLLFPALPPQAGTAESVCGMVQDQSGASVSGAALELRTANTRLDATTDAGGQFCFRPLEPGEYELTVQARGFRTNQQKVIVHAGESTRLTISLGLEAVAEQVTVAEGSADVSSLNIAQTQVG